MDVPWTVGLLSHVPSAATYVGVEVDGYAGVLFNVTVTIKTNIWQLHTQTVHKYCGSIAKGTIGN